jgi:glycosyltransferase involved in cell wall biosynthesis
VAFNHGQVVVSTRAAAACYPEARNRENCRLVDRLEDMITVIPELVADPAERLRLGRAARETFEKHFTRTALLPRYEAVLKAIQLQ